MTGFKSLFNKIKPGMCRLTMNGVAINVNGEYKVYDVETGTLTNCGDFAFDIGDEMFFAIPTNAVTRGDIILGAGGPATVINVNDHSIESFDYKSGTIVNIVPERHIFFGNTYFYTKIVSPFTSFAGGSSESMMMMMMMQSMMKDGSEMSKMMAMSMMMSGGFNFGKMFGNMFEGAPSIDKASEASEVKS